MDMFLGGLFRSKLWNSGDDLSATCFQNSRVFTLFQSYMYRFFRLTFLNYV
jgi:hypothetical protein